VKLKLKFGILAATAALLAAGCGGGGGGKTTGDAASVVPDNVAAFVSVDTNVDSQAWQKSKALLDRFPGKDAILMQVNSALQRQELD
jgi:hypothetical protein